jgi:hypothetical protein
MPDFNIFGPGRKTRKPAGRGTVFRGYDDSKPVPVPVHTLIQKHTVLPAPVSCLILDYCDVPQSCGIESKAGENHYSAL